MKKLQQNIGGFLYEPPLKEWEVNSMQKLALIETDKRYELFMTSELKAVAKIEAELMKGARHYFEENEFTEVLTPHITKATGSCENVNTVFGIDYFGSQGYLAQTGQLYLESLVPTLGKVFCVGPSFRAEPDVDNRHLVEFPLIEMEIPGDFEEMITHIEKLLCRMLSGVLTNRHEELDFLGIDKKRLINVKRPFKRITYNEAVEILAKESVKWGDDLKSRHEKFLAEYLGNKPLFITHFPVEIKFFNMKTNRDNPKVVNSTDLILPGSGEAVGAAEREYEHERLLEKLKKSMMLKQLEQRGGSIKDFDWYLNFYKKYGGNPHSGFGMGLNRVTQFVLGWNDIRASTVFPLNRVSLM
jgi:asparaginyl-tRNA synthetase